MLEFEYKGGMSSLMDAVELVRAFKAEDLALRVARLEHEAEGKGVRELAAMLEQRSVSPELFRAAVEVKRSAAQIDEVVHAVGTLLCLKEILEPEEKIERLSLAAGNTGRDFDLETDMRIAEFTFIDWKGGPESIRKQKVFKDFYSLAEANTDKRRFLYLIGKVHGPKVFVSRSPCRGMLRKFAGLQAEFVRKYGTTITVREFYESRKALVQVIDLTDVAPRAAQALAASAPG